MYELQLILCLVPNCKCNYYSNYYYVNEIFILQNNT